MAPFKMSKNLMLAAGLTFLSAVVVIIAFSTPYWLMSDGTQRGGAKFIRLGLWEACFNGFTDIYYRYDVEFRGCRWIFDEDYYIILDVLEPSFFIAVQVFFTFGFVTLLLACILLLALLLCCPTGREVFVTRLLACLILASAIFSTIAVITFGARGDGRDWMPDPDHNYLGWAFGLGVVGAFFEYVAAVLFWVESRIIYKKRLQRQQQVFSLDQPPGKI